MKNFIYNSPTKIIFGEGQIKQLKSELKERSVKTALLVYGFNSIKKSGLYDDIVSTCKDLDITLIEENNVAPNPDIKSVRSGVVKCREHNVDFIIAAGGGSVVDCAKAIGFSSFYEGDPWDVYLRKGDSNKSLPLCAIITLAATGTETNGNSVISNDETNEKRSVAYPMSIPEFAIIDPTYTLTVNKHHTIAGSIDIIMHILEQFMSATEDTKTSDYMSLGVIKSVIENTFLYLQGENTYRVRSNLSWASTIGLNWILGVDKVGDWATHRLSYPLTKEHNVTHGYALAMIFTSWLRVALKYNPEVMKRRLTTISEFLFSSVDYMKVPDLLDDIFSSFGAKVRITSLNLTENDIMELINKALQLGNVGTVIDVDREKALEIFNLANR